MREEAESCGLADATGVTAIFMGRRTYSTIGPALAVRDVLGGGLVGGAGAAG